MNWDRTSNLIALGLVGVCFVLALGKVLFRDAVPRTDDGREGVTIRFAHWQLEGNVQEAFDAIAREYEKLHPNVRVIQMRIPERIYPIWLTTQIVGETAPDLVQIGIGMTTDKLARFFVPLTTEVAKPNPYNAGTPLADVPWQSTFVDGMKGGNCFSTDLLEYYGIPTTMFTIRIYYNRDLLRRITGSDATPSTYRELKELCEKVDAYRPPSGDRVIPIAGSKYNAPFLIGRLFSGLTMNLRQKQDILLNGDPTPEDVALSFLLGRWSLRDPSVTEGYALQRAVGQHMQTGFLQLSREDATFRFIQGRALMIASGAWDASSLIGQAPFEVGVIRIPYPTPSDPEFGHLVRGPETEAATDTGASFGLARASKNPEAALDFLHFLSSQSANRIFVEKSRWLPAVVGVDPAPGMEAFSPLLDGYVGGISFSPTVFPDTARTLNNSLNELLASTGSVDAYLDRIEPSFRRFLLQDLRLGVEKRTSNIRRFDTPIAARRLILLQDPAQDRIRRQYERMLESQTTQESQTYWLDYQLKELSAHGQTH